MVGGIPGTHCEVKRTEKINIYKAMEQAIGDAGDKIPYVAHRRNRGEWLIILRADDFMKILLKKYGLLAYSGESLPGEKP